MNSRAPVVKLYRPIKDQPQLVRHIENATVHKRWDVDASLIDEAEEGDVLHQLMQEAPIDKQVGGRHYKSLAIQPVTYAMANNLGFMEGSVIKYVTRWHDKDGIRDLEKAKHFIEMLIEFHSGRMSFEDFNKGIQKAMKAMEAT